MYIFFLHPALAPKRDYSRSNYTSTQTEREREREEFPDQVNKVDRTGNCVPVTPNPPSHLTGGKQADQS